jgi:hypothetical protein
MGAIHSREENALKQKPEPGSDPIGLEKALKEQTGKYREQRFVQEIFPS